MTQYDAHALVIGINDYSYYNKLRNAANDAIDIGSILVDPALCSYPQNQVTLLTDAAATRTRIVEALSGLARSVSSNSTVFVFFAGHGMRISTGPYSGDYILPIDSRKVDSDGVFKNTVISGEELALHLRDTPAKKIIVVLDCCHAQGIGILRAEVAYEFRDGLSDSYLSKLATGAGRVVIAAARSDESAADGAGRNGLLTHHLLAGLRGGAGGNDEYIRIFGLFNYVQPLVTKDCPTQHPVFKAEIQEDFPVALRNGGRSCAAPSLMLPKENFTKEYTRAQLLSMMCSLIPGQFDQLLFNLEIPGHLLSSPLASQMTRASEIIRIVEQPGGIGYTGLTVFLREVLPHLP